MTATPGHTHHQRPPRSRSRWVRVLVAVLLLAAIGYTWAHHYRTPAATTAGTSPAQPVYPAATPTDATPSPSATTSPSSAATTRPLTGTALATAWLHAYLDRTDATSDTWQNAIKHYSDPALPATLADPAGQVDLDWPAWKITSIKPLVDPHQPVTTPTRQVTTWIVSLTDPTHPRRHTQRSYTLTAYRGDHNTWWITFAEQGYLSDG